MAASDDAMETLCAAMLRDYGAGAEFQVALGELVGRYRRKHHQAMLDAEAARLLPLGAAVVVERMGGCRATAYNRARRYFKLSKPREAG